ncbi:MAG: molybdopterin-dependent oxidoreductase [Myxococcota bacterium]
MATGTPTMDSPAPSSATEPTGAQAAALARTAEELELHPMEGMAKWLGRLLHPIAFRMVSMVEQPTETMSGPLSPVKGYFRRDRHRHPEVDAQTYRLKVTGVANPREFTLEDLKALPWENRVLVMECAGNGNHLMGSAGLIGQAKWSGPSMKTILDACGGPGPATHFACHGLDPIPLIRRGYHYGLSLEEYTRSRALLALEMNGEPLPRPRGFPVRLVVPGIYSMSHVKWLSHIEGKTKAHDGIHNRFVFVNKRRNAQGKWVKEQARWIGLKSMVTRCIRDGNDWTLTGWAWGGGKEVASIKVSVDGGKTWDEANVSAPGEHFGEPDGIVPEDLEHAWTVWTYRWRAPSAGRYVIASRAFAADGEAQRLEEDPEVKGHFNQTRVKWRRVDVPA